MVKINQFVSVILPCYNEKGNIVPLIEEIHSVLSFCKHQIIVVDDNSPDGTYDMLVSKNYDYIKLLLRKENPSLARSIRKGIEESDGDIIIIMDSDFNHQPKYLPQMIANLEYYNCVLASRYVYGGKMHNYWRYQFSWMFNIFVRLLTGGKITETLYGFLSIRKEDLFKVDFDKIFWGYGDYCIRLMYYLQKENFTFLQFPAVNGHRLEGSGNTKLVKVFWLYLIEVIMLVLRERLKLIKKKQA